MKATEMCATTILLVKHHIALRKHNVVFFYLLIITTIAIIKANAIIVIPTKPYRSKYIIINIACSII